MSNCPFYIGQEVVALRTPNQNEPDVLYEITPKIKKGNIYHVNYMSYEKGWVFSDEKSWFVELSEFPDELYDYEFFAPVSRLRVSEHLTIAEGLAVDAVEERADVHELVNN